MGLSTCILFVSILAAAESICRDNVKNCEIWASKGYCTSPGHASYMKKDCMKSCKLCKDTDTGNEKSDCRNDHPSCDYWQSHGECIRIPGFMLKNCRKSCGLCSTPSARPPTMSPVSSSASYPCQDNHPFCNNWSRMGECEKNPEYMLRNCKRSCKQCEQQTNQFFTQPPTRPPTLAPTKRIPTTTTRYPYETSSTLECGKRTRSYEAEQLYRIVGGRSRGPGRWPWQVGLYRSMRQRFPYCGGTLIQPDVVLTAAHCRAKVGTLVKLGDYNLRREEGTEEVISVAKVFTHEAFNRYTHRNDIALLKLSRSAKLGDGINTACLPKIRAAVDEDCYVTGWGNIGYWNYHSLTLREAKVPVVHRYYCNIRYRGRVTRKMLCAGYPGGGADACEGDSGGPLVCEKEGKFYLHGITSWGYGCGRWYTPGVYTDVSKYLDWIKEKSNANYDTTDERTRRIIYPIQRIIYIFGNDKKLTRSKETKSKETLNATESSN